MTNIRNTWMRLIIPMTALLALALSIGCSPASSTAPPPDFKKYVVADAQKIDMINYAQQLEADSIPFTLRTKGATFTKFVTTEEYQQYIDFTSSIGGQDAGRQDQFIIVAAGPYSDYILAFGNVKEEVYSSKGTSEGDWFNNNSDVYRIGTDFFFASLADNSLHIMGEESGFRALQEALNDEQLLVQDSSDMGKLINNTDFNGLEAKIELDCFLFQKVLYKRDDPELEGCLGTGMSLMKGDDVSADFAFVLLFDSEENLENATEDVKQRVETIDTREDGTFEFVKDIEKKDDILKFTVRATVDN